MSDPSGSLLGQGQRTVKGLAFLDFADIEMRPKPAGRRRHELLRTVADHALLIAFSLLFLIPVIFVLLSSVMTNTQVLSQDLWPQPFQLSNYKTVIDTIPLWQYGWNTVQISAMSTIGVVLSSIPVAYALSRMRWKGRQFAFVLILSTLMLPFQVTVIPLYVWFTKLHLPDWLPFLGGPWIPSFKPLVVPSFFGDAFSIFLLRQFFMSIPEELSEAARVDGASEWQILTRVIVPLAKPAIAAVALFNFLYNWNDFFGPLLYLVENPKLWTLAIGLNEFRGQHHVEFNLIMAASIMFMIPVIVLFFLAQRVFIEGVTLTGVKG